MIGTDSIRANKNLLRMSNSINRAISRPETPVCSMPIVIVMLILNRSQRDILDADFNTCS